MKRVFNFMDKWYKKVMIVVAFLSLGGVFSPFIRGTATQIKTVFEIVNEYPELTKRVTFLENQNEVLIDLIRANMKQVDSLDYGGWIPVEDPISKEVKMALTEIKLREAFSSDYYVFVPEIRGTQVYAAKWHWDEGKYLYFDHENDRLWLYVVDLQSIVQR